ncbi:MAG: hypothetical protein ACJ8AO_20275 [Gemmatimonadaceae bacterium]
MEPTVRRFTDADGLHWRVRRFEQTLGESYGAVSGSWPVAGSLARDWLTFACFETGWLRRLTPVPDDWETCGEAELRRYHAAARHVRQLPKSGPLP